MNKYIYFLNQFSGLVALMVYSKWVGTLIERKKDTASADIKCTHPWKKNAQTNSESPVREHR